MKSSNSPLSRNRILLYGVILTMSLISATRFVELHYITALKKNLTSVKATYETDNKYLNNLKSMGADMSSYKKQIEDLKSKLNSDNSLTVSAVDTNKLLSETYSYLEQYKVERLSVVLQTPTDIKAKQPSATKASNNTGIYDIVTKEDGYTYYDLQVYCTGSLADVNSVLTNVRKMTTVPFTIHMTSITPVSKMKFPDLNSLGTGISSIEQNVLNTLYLDIRVYIDSTG